MPRERPTAEEPYGCTLRLDVREGNATAQVLLPCDFAAISRTTDTCIRLTLPVDAAHTVALPCNLQALVSDAVIVSYRIRQTKVGVLPIDCVRLAQALEWQPAGGITAPDAAPAPSPPAPRKLLLYRSTASYLQVRKLRSCGCSVCSSGMQSAPWCSMAHRQSAGV